MGVVCVIPSQMQVKIEDKGRVQTYRPKYLLDTIGILSSSKVPPSWLVISYNGDRKAYKKVERVCKGGTLAFPVTLLWQDTPQSQFQHIVAAHDHIIASDVPRHMFKHILFLDDDDVPSHDLIYNFERWRCIKEKHTCKPIVWWPSKIWFAGFARHACLKDALETSLVQVINHAMGREHAGSIYSIDIITRFIGNAVMGTTKYRSERVCTKTKILKSAIATERHRTKDIFARIEKSVSIPMHATFEITDRFLDQAMIAFANYLESNGDIECFVEPTPMFTTDTKIEDTRKMPGVTMAIRMWDPFFGYPQDE